MPKTRRSTAWLSPWRNRRSPIRRVIAEDLAHSEDEKRHFCFGDVDGGILTVRFTYRGGVIRIFGSGYWRKGKAIYERENAA